jgi:hypothetical protein
MALIFKRRHEIKKQEDPGARLMNRIIMVGLLLFLGFSVLNEKRVLDKTKLVWDASFVNSVNNKSENIRVIENDVLSFQLTEDEIEKIKDLPRNADGRVELFSLKLNRIYVREEPNTAPEAAQKQAEQLNAPLPVKVVEPAPAMPATEAPLKPEINNNMTP